MELLFLDDYFLLALLSLSILIICIVFIYRRKKRRYDVRKITIEDIDLMEGYEFEHYLYVLLASVGFENTLLTKSSRDFGADLIFTNLNGEKSSCSSKKVSKSIRVRCSPRNLQQKRTMTLKRH
ncbi:restriction endonuclease [Bacillus sp. JCM 19034]|uniref:restriction endonuclease n=1 Tax=Bacillus sp. JCM 19034 TaxID=1481928 RepID=UPI0007832F0A|nr:restriction endonuclease [Bacillus sp. JCM 19034]